MTTWTIALPAGYQPHPSYRLFQCGANARLHRYVKAKIVKTIRVDTKALARAAGTQPIPVPVAIRAVQHPAPGTRALDAENIAPIVKAVIDGLRDAGVLRNDSPKFVTNVSYAVGERRPGSQLVLHLSTLDDVESEAA